MAAAWRQLAECWMDELASHYNVDFLDEHYGAGAARVGSFDHSRGRFAEELDGERLGWLAGRAVEFAEEPVIWMARLDRIAAVVW